MKKTDKARKPTGNFGKPIQEKDATDGQWLDTIMQQVQEATAVAERTATYNKAHPRYLSVPDAWTQKEFIKNANQVYRLAHIPNRKRGRRSEEMFAIEHLTKLSDELGRQPTKGGMIKSLIDELKLSKNTAGKYAKLYRISCVANKDITQLSQADQQWLRKKFGSESLSQAWWMDRIWKGIDEIVKSSGIEEEIRKIFAGEYTETELRQMREEIEKLRQERFSRGTSINSQTFIRAENGHPRSDDLAQRLVHITPSTR